MLVTSIPFDYATLLDPGDRVRKARKTTTTRVRRAPKRAIKDA
jgi:hypothetical protein